MDVRGRCVLSLLRRPLLRRCSVVACWRTACFACSAVLFLRENLRCWKESSDASRGTAAHSTERRGGPPERCAGPPERRCHSVTQPWTPSRCGPRPRSRSDGGLCCPASVRNFAASRREAACSDPGAVSAFQNHGGRAGPAQSRVTGRPPAERQRWDHRQTAQAERRADAGPRQLGGSGRKQAEGLQHVR